jgi:hypothetical protein
MLEKPRKPGDLREVDSEIGRRGQLNRLLTGKARPIDAAVEGGCGAWVGMGQCGAPPTLILYGGSDLHWRCYRVVNVPRWHRSIAAVCDRHGAGIEALMRDATREIRQDAQEGIRMTMHHEHRIGLLPITAVPLRNLPPSPKAVPE